MNGEKKTILVCPLGWGLGHASRDIPIIESFLRDGHEVIVAGDEQSLALLSKRFVGIKTIHFPSFKVRFSKRKSQLFPLIWIAIQLPYHILKEHFALNRLVKDYQIDLVISDNRYGLWCKNAKTVLITHQLKVLFPTPFRSFELAGQWAVRFFAEKFDSCWIPDFLGSDNLAGELSHPSKIPSNAEYIGILSRFLGIEINPTSINWDLVGVVSGPSPQRELFIEQVEKLVRRQKTKTLIMTGKPDEGTDIIEKNGIWYAGHLNDSTFASVLKSSKYLICRAGYSSIMDLVALGVKCLIVPTPGQTEQEYLAKHLSNEGLFKVCQQNKLENIDISEAKVELGSHDSSNLLQNPMRI
ncbi:MAG: hypothetical protein EHM93_07950 [Bacteroidales bacterium]|nr:MAG: hypothetical protein EHM93_07950 [Bacteroidales bacterium]